MNVVDLFSGCGGLALGASAAGLNIRLAFDVDRILTSSFEKNHPSADLILADLANVSGFDILQRVSGQVVGVIGGPPCQAFSAIGRRKMDDPRRSYVGHFFRIVSELRPWFFVMENVRGLAYSHARSVLDDGIDCLGGRYRILGPLVLDAADFGAATRRQRLFVLGFDPAHCDILSAADIDAVKSKPATVKAAIGDLASAIRLGEEEGFDVWKIRQPGRPSRYSSTLRSPDKTFTSHRSTAHSSKIVRRFKAIRPRNSDTIGRHYRLAWDGQCPTLRAGTGNDRGSYQSVRPIHPEDPRVITVREAARLQGFPDAFRFHSTIWHSFRMIGNSVSPIISKALFSLIASRVDIQLPFREAAE